MPLRATEPFTVPQPECEQTRKLERMLEIGAPALVGPSGERIELPSTIYQVLRRMVELMAAGQAITLMPDDQVVTTQRAADILGMSRPFLVKLLETGAMPHHRVGNQRRVYLRDVLTFGRERDAQRREALDRLARQAFEAGLYDHNTFPDGGQDD